MAYIKSNFTAVLVTSDANNGGKVACCCSAYERVDIYITLVIWTLSLILFGYYY